MKFTHRTILAVLTAAAAIFNFACPVKVKQTKLKDLWGQTFEIKDKGLTPKGANIWKQDGTVITNDDLSAIDDGLSRLFAKAKCYVSEHDGKPLSEVTESHRGMKHSEYIVAVLKSTDADSNGDPAIRVPAGQYAGTEYDKGGYILIAGQMLAIGVPYGNVMAVPDHQSNFERMSAAVEYEGEHIVAGHNLPTLYAANETHGQGGGHPFINDICSKDKPATEVVKPSTYAVGTYDTPYGKSLILLTK